MNVNGQKTVVKEKRLSDQTGIRKIKVCSALKSAAKKKKESWVKGFLFFQSEKWQLEVCCCTYNKNQAKKEFK